MQRKHTGELCRTTVLCIDSYEQGVPVGRFYNPGCGRTCVFHSLTQFLIEVEQMLDDMGLPQSFTAGRSFTPRRDGRLSRWEGERPMSGELATFSIRFLFRQNASWQGSIRWMEGGKEEHFRSALELILLLESALSSAGVEKAV